MTQRIGPKEGAVTLKFGGGLHTRASPDEIDPREAAGGFNFTIDIDNRNLRNRPAFDLVATAPNAASIRGGASLLKSDGTVSTIFQAGNTVYKWTGGTSLTSVGTVSAGCKLRGHWRTHSWNLSDVVLITDLTLTDTVYKWDGTTLASVAFVDETGAAFGNFYAKYCGITNERAIFANVKAGSATPHLIVGCTTSNYNKITVNNRPSSSLGTGDPFYLPVPDLKPINGFLSTYLGTMVSTERGEIFNLTGSSAKDYAFSTFYANSGASGLEAVEEIGNDFIVARAGRIESVRDSNTYGNSEATDLTAIIADQIGSYTGWTIVFNTRTRKAYAFPTGQSEVWVFDPAIRDANVLNTLVGRSGNISPWMRWETSHSMAFQPTMVMSMLDPSDGLEYIFMGDSSGHIYRMEGTGTSGDGGSYPIDMQFTSKLFSTPLNAKAYDFEGYIKYAQNLSATVTLTFQFQGEKIFNNAITIDLPAAPGKSYYSGGAYYSGGFYYNSFSGRLTRSPFVVPGSANDFQVLTEVEGVNAVSINEIGIRFKAVS